MTNKELQEELKKYPDDATICKEDSEWGIEDIQEVRIEHNNSTKEVFVVIN